MHKMEWSSGIQDQQTFMGFVEKMKLDPEPFCNYEQAARLFFEGSIVGKPDRCVMVALQVPTSAVCKEERERVPWLDAYEVNSMDDYDASNEIFSMWGEGKITYDNAEQLMLELAKDLCD